MHILYWIVSINAYWRNQETFPFNMYTMDLSSDGSSLLLPAG
jgi:hypothetical protein